MFPSDIPQATTEEEECRSVVVYIVVTAVVAVLLTAIVAGIIMAGIICCLKEKYKKSKYVPSKNYYMEKNQFSRKDTEMKQKI